MEPSQDRIVAWPEGLHLHLLHASLLQGEEMLEAFHRWSSTVVFDDLDYASMGLMPLLRWNLNRHGISHPLLSRIGSVGRYLLIQTMMKLGAVGDLVSDLNRVGIPSLLLWGSSIGQQYYPQSSLRPVNRCGVMIRDEDKNRAREQLNLTGWIFSVENDEGEDAPGRIHRIGYPNVSLQLRWESDSRFARQPETRVWDDAREILVQGNRTKAFHPMDEIVQACRDGRRQGATLSSMLWLVDCAMMISKGVFSNGSPDFTRHMMDSAERLFIIRTLDRICRETGRKVASDEGLQLK